MVAPTGQLPRIRSTATSAFVGEHIAQRVHTPKMPGEPMTVQPSRARKLTSDDV
jgi:hypothetical protein